MTEPTAPGSPTPRPVPDLGFFGPAGPARSQLPLPPNPPAVLPSQPAEAPNLFAPPAGQFGPPPVAPFGAGSPAVYAPYPAVQQRGGLPGWAIAAICVPVVLIVMAILAAIAIPTFLDQRERASAEATTITLPEAVEGLPRSTDPEELARLESMLHNFPAGMSEPHGFVYSDGASHRIVVVSARFPYAAGPAELRNLFAGFDDGLAPNAPPGVTMSEPFDREPGRLGGRIRCSTMSGAASGQLCTAADAVSMLTIVDVSAGATDPDLPRRVREAVVSRR